MLNREFTNTSGELNKCLFLLKERERVLDVSRYHFFKSGLSVKKYNYYKIISYTTLSIVFAKQTYQG